MVRGILQEKKIGGREIERDLRFKIQEIREFDSTFFPIPILTLRISGSFLGRPIRIIERKSGKLKDQ